MCVYSNIALLNTTKKTCWSISQQGAFLSKLREEKQIRCPRVHIYIYTYIWFWYVLVPLVCKLKMFKPLVTIIFDRVSAPNVDPRQLSQTVACRPCFHWHKTNEKCRKFPAFSKRRCPRNNSKTLCFADWLSVTLSMMMQVVGVPAIQKKWRKWFLSRCAGEWTLDPAICCWPVKKMKFLT